MVQQQEESGTNTNWLMISDSMKIKSEVCWLGKTWTISIYFSILFLFIL